MTPAATAMAPPQARPGAAVARFLAMRGRAIEDSDGILWHSVPGRFWMSLPYEATVEPDQERLARMLRRTRMAGARFPSLERGGLESGAYVLRADRYDLGVVHIKHRARVRHGLQLYRVCRAGAEQLLAQGLTLNRDTMDRQGRYDAEFARPGPWSRLVRAIEDCPEAAAYGAFAGPRLDAYMITCRDAGWLHILHQMSRREALPDFPNHTLTYEVTRMAAEDTEVHSLCYGLMPLVPIEGLHEYKLRFRYNLEPHRSAVQLHPTVETCSGPASAALRLLRTAFPGSQRLARAQSIFDGARLGAVAHEQADAHAAR